MSDPLYTVFSVLIPSYNRADEIHELLDSFTRLVFPADRYEIIIADDGSTDNTRSVVEQYQRRNALNIRYISQQNQGPGAARNLAMEHAEGDFFVFIDSDVTVPRDWLTNIAEVVNAEKADAYGGADTYRDEFPALLKAINYTMTSFLTTGGMRGKKGKKLAKFYPRSFNMGLSRALWRRIGGFGSLRHGQDIEYSHRIISSGASVVFVDNAPVFHKRRTSLKRFYKQVFNWGVARVNLYKLDNAMLEPLHAAPAAGTLMTALVLLTAPFFTVAFYMALAGVSIWIAMNVFMMLDAARMYRSLKPAMLVPLVAPAQLFGYGAGFIYNFLRRVVFGKGEKVGFKRNYYK